MSEKVWVVFLFLAFGLMVLPHFLPKRVSNVNRGAVAIFGAVIGFIGLIIKAIGDAL